MLRHALKQLVCVLSSTKMVQMCNTIHSHTYEVPEWLHVCICNDSPCTHTVSNARMCLCFTSYIRVCTCIGYPQVSDGSGYKRLPPRSIVSYEEI